MNLNSTLDQSEGFIRYTLFSLYYTPTLGSMIPLHHDPSMNQTLDQSEGPLHEPGPRLGS